MSCRRHRRRYRKPLVVAVVSLTAPRAGVWHHSTPWTTYRSTSLRSTDFDPPQSGIAEAWVVATIGSNRPVRDGSACAEVVPRRSQPGRWGGGSAAQGESHDESREGVEGGG